MHADRKWNPPRFYAEGSGQHCDTIRGFIRDGELKATNFARGNHRPKWLIHEDDWQAFVDKRANISTPKVKPSATRRRRTSNVREFF